LPFFGFNVVANNSVDNDYTSYDPDERPEGAMLNHGKSSRQQPADETANVWYEIEYKDEQGPEKCEINIYNQQNNVTKNGD
jgi:hypothetical protein